MGTRARIAVKHPINGTYASIYTHWDGYPSHHGPILLEHYSNVEAVFNLMALGDLSSLGRSIGTKHNFDRAPEGECNSYSRDRGEPGTEAIESATLAELKALTQDCGGEYLYLFDDGIWYVAEGGVGFFGAPASEPPAELRPLAEAVAEEKQED